MFKSSKEKNNVIHRKIFLMCSSLHHSSFLITPKIHLKCLLFSQPMIIVNPILNRLCRGKLRQRWSIFTSPAPWPHNFQTHSTSIIYFPGSKSEALRLGVHLILLYFIRISLSTSPPRSIFFCRWWMVGGGPLFGSLNLLIKICYIVQI